MEFNLLASLPLPPPYSPPTHPLSPPTSTHPTSLQSNVYNRRLRTNNLDLLSIITVTVTRSFDSFIFFPFSVPFSLPQLPHFFFDQDFRLYFKKVYKVLEVLSANIPQVFLSPLLCAFSHLPTVVVFPRFITYQFLNTPLQLTVALVSCLLL